MKIAIVSEKGGRENNQDYIGRFRVKDTYCFALADGLGGYSGGEIASSLAVKTVIESFNENAQMSQEAMSGFFESAHNAVAEKSSESLALNRMSTTLAVLITDGKNAIWAHCGDSRLYRFKRNLIQEVTDDHSVAFASFMAGDIEYDDIRRSPDQNKLTRTIGGFSVSQPDISEVVKVERNTSFLLCSDGFWEYVSEDFMESAKKKSSTPKEWLSDMLAERRRNAPADADNYSAIAVFI